MPVMWMSELSQSSGVPVATVKFYLREGLLPPGEAVSTTRARYDERHVRRLRLVRALVETAGLGLEQVRRVLRTIEESDDTLQAVGGAHLELAAEPDPAPSAQALERVSRLLAAGPWRLDAQARHARSVAAALDALERAGIDFDDATLGVYAAAARAAAAKDVERMIADDPGLEAEATATYAALGTVLAEPVLLGLRRLAQEDLTRVRLGGAGSVP